MARITVVPGGMTYGKILRTAYNENRDPLDLLHEQVCDLNGQRLTAAINGFFRYTDASHKAPVFGSYDVTERAIRKVRQQRADGCGPDDGLPYILALNEEISAQINAHF